MFFSWKDYSELMQNYVLDDLIKDFKIYHKYTRKVNKASLQILWLSKPDYKNYVILLHSDHQIQWFSVMSLGTLVNSNCIYLWFHCHLFFWQGGFFHVEILSVDIVGNLIQMFNKPIKFLQLFVKRWGPWDHCT